jgi:hypothetical protein
MDKVSPISESLAVSTKIAYTGPGQYCQMYAYYTRVSVSWLYSAFGWLLSLYWQIRSSKFGVTIQPVHQTSRVCASHSNFLFGGFESGSEDQMCWFAFNEDVLSSSRQILLHKVTSRNRVLVCYRRCWIEMGHRKFSTIFQFITYSPLTFLKYKLCNWKCVAIYLQ